MARGGGAFCIRSPIITTYTHRSCHLNAVNLVRATHDTIHMNHVHIDHKHYTTAISPKRNVSIPSLTLDENSELLVIPLHHASLLPRLRPR